MLKYLVMIMSRQNVQEARDGGLINDYLADRISSALEFGMSDELAAEAIDDARDAFSCGVESEDDYNVYFMVKNVAPSIAADTFSIARNDFDTNGFCAYIVESKEKPTLTDLRLLMHKWLCTSISKVAYPNVGGIHEEREEYDLDKWVASAREMYSKIRSSKKIDHADALSLITADWDIDERYKFEVWLRYYESATPEKYNVKISKLENDIIKEALIPESWVNDPNRSNSVNPSVTPLEAPHESDIQREKRVKKERLDNANLFKKKLKSRIRSIMRLLERYNDLLPHQNLDSVHDEMYALDKSISKLNVYATMKDTVARSANIIRRFGFPEGADMLEKYADGETIQLPEAGDPAPNLPDGSRPKITTQQIISRLEAISRDLRNRDLVRELASVDILLNELGIASFFPDLASAQSKLIESFSYASNKIEATVSSLRGSGGSAGAQLSMNAPPPAAAATPPAPLVPEKKVNLPTAPKEDKVDIPIPQPIDNKMDPSSVLNKPVSKMQNQLPKG